MDTLIFEMLEGLSANGSDHLARSSSAAGRVYDLLRQRIVSMDLPPESTLSRSELAHKYGVSQTPIREALQRLEQDGLVKIFPQSKTVVTKIDIRQLFEAHFLRVSVECETVRRLSLAKDENLISKLKAVAKMQNAVKGEADMGMFNELDEAFHQIMFAGVDQLELFRMVRAKGGHLARAQRLDLPVAGKVAQILNDHTEIIAALEAGDADVAQVAMRKHLTGTVARIDALQKENPGYFQSV
ncbi:MAG: GntR family transcriptional regulator [Paracoccaceae bacterium]